MFSKDKIELSVEQLKTNLKTLVTRAAAVPRAPDSYLVGNRVSHQFVVKQQDGSDKHEWFTGKVISQVPGYPDWFNILYDDDEAIYSYRLLDDMADGCLRILTHI